MDRSSLRDRIRDRFYARTGREYEVKHTAPLEMDTSSPPTVDDFPGMASVCLLHSSEQPRDVYDRAPERKHCVCERADNALARLTAELALTEADIEECKMHAAHLRSQIHVAFRNASMAPKAAGQ